MNKYFCLFFGIFSLFFLLSLFSPKEMGRRIEAFFIIIFVILARKPSIKHYGCNIYLRGYIFEFLPFLFYLIQESVFHTFIGHFQNNGHAAAGKGPRINRKSLHCFKKAFFSPDQEEVRLIID